MKISILVEIDENLNCGQNHRKFRIWSVFMKILIFGESLWKFWFRPKLSENLDLGQHFRKISILVNIFGKID